MNKFWNWVWIIILICLLFIAIPLHIANRKPTKEQLRPMFDEYVEKFNKTYKSNPLEYETRFQHFLASIEEIEKLNAASIGPEEHRARYGLTQLSDMSKAEYKSIHLSDERYKNRPEKYGRSWRHHDNRNRYDHDSGAKEDVVIVNQDKKLFRRKRAALPLQFDWRAQGVIGPVYSQGLCGACWAFSTVGIIEAMNALSTGKLVPLSVQEAIDCAALGNEGCNGGDICLLLDWLTLSKKPLSPAKEYPLRLIDGACRLKKNATGVMIKTFTCDDFVGAEDKILEAIATHGPVAVAVNALTWQNYLGGVIQYHCGGTPAELNHAVYLIGYDLAADVPYYIAKNSWGTEFGNGGYVNLAVGNNMCGLANEVSTVTV